MFEKPKTESVERNTKEKHEQEGEAIAGGRGELFARITKRILEERNNIGCEISEAGEIEKLIMSKIKKIPVVNGIVASSEGLMGAEYGEIGKPNRKLNTKESMVKYGLGALMMFKGVLEIKEEKETGEKPENILSKKTLEWLKETVERKKEEDSQGKSTKALEAIFNYLKENPDMVIYFENKINQAV